MTTDDLDETIAKRFPGTNEVIGFLAGLLPFFVHLSTSETTTINGQVQSHRQSDFIAIGGGAIALLVSLWGFTLLKKTSAASRGRRLLANVILMGLGALQLVRGLGLL
jgi:hypothetical protein